MTTSPRQPRLAWAAPTREVFGYDGLAAGQRHLDDGHGAFRALLARHGVTGLRRSFGTARGRRHPRHGGGRDLG